MERRKKIMHRTCGAGGIACDCCNTTRPRSGASSRKARAKGARRLAREARAKEKRAEARDREASQ